MEIIRVGIVGAGDNTRTRHIPGLRAQPGVEIVSVCNSTLESSQRVSKEYDIPVVYEQWRELVTAPDTDAIVIGTWPYLHHIGAVTALSHGKHVMVEARMAMNAAEAEDMLAVSRDNPHLVAQIVPSPMTLHVDATIQELIADGYLGDILAVEVQAGGTFIDRESPLTWRQDIELSGLNIMAMGIWYEAVMRWIGEATRVMAMGSTFVKMRKDATGRVRAVHIPDHLDIVAQMACGAQANFRFSAVTGLNGGNCATLYGSDGTLRYADGKLYGGQRTDGGLKEIVPENPGGWRVEEEFVNAIRGKEAITHTDFATGVKYMRFTEAVTHSMQTGAAVAI